MPFNFQLLGVPWQAGAVRQVVDGLEAALPSGAWPNYVLGNHDESRLATRIGHAPARVAAMLLLALRGTPTLYYGDEIGLTDVDVPPERQQDPWGRRVPGLGRDPCRTPMQWSPAPNAGFSAPETPSLWLPLAADYREVNVERQLADPTSLLNLYRRLLGLRCATPALQWGAYQPLDNVPRTCFVFVRQAGDQRLLIALNFAGEEHNLAPLPSASGHLLLSTYLDREGAVSLANLHLRGNEGVIVELESEG
jgi:alpha-glucosidase